MPIKVTCPKCQGVLHAPDDAGGKRGKCPTCGTVLAIPSDAPKVTQEAAAFAAPPPPPPAEPKRSSFTFPPADEPRRESAGRLPPPAPVAEPRRPTDPFAKPGRPPAVPAPADDAVVRAWRKTRRGLGLVQTGLFLLLVSVLAYAGLAIARNYGTQLPAQDPGYLQVNGLPSDREIEVGAVVVPAVLGLLLVAVGRLGVSNAPRTSHARGLLTWASVATLVGLAGLVAFAVPTVLAATSGMIPKWPADASDSAAYGETLLEASDLNGMLQRFGLAVALTFLPLGWLWFVTGVGRVGAALHHDWLARRGTKLLVYVGLVFALLVIGRVACVVYAGEVNRMYGEHVRPQWDQLGEHRPAVSAGLIGLAGLVVWWWYSRLVAAGRRAIREWAERNAP